MRLTSLPTVALVALAGCGHTSSYAPPADGRARAVWHEDHVAVEAAGAPLTDACLSEIFALTDSELLHLHEGDYTRALAPRPGPGVYIVAAALWTPRYYGPRIVVAHPGIAPVFPWPHPPLFLPRPALVVPPPHPIGVAAPSSGGGGPHLGGDSGKMWAILAAVALVVMPAVALGLALSRPEDSDTNAEAIDQANAYNDLLRSPGSPCAVWSGS